MGNADKTVLVTGATGNQGGATARHLLADGWQVRALVRDPAAPAAERLASAGAELVVGDMTDRDALDTAMRGAYGVFSVQPAQQAPHFDGAEVRMGVNVADAALAAGVEHLVYASVGAVERSAGIPSWQTKWKIEEHLRAIGLPFTALRPVMFMENHASRTFGVTADNSLIRMIPPGATVQLIAVRDIGAFAALAFADPDSYVGAALELAGDELTREQLIAAIEGAVGVPLRVDPVPAEVLTRLRIDPDSAEGVKNFGGWQADIPALRARYPRLLTFDAWLALDGKEKFAALLS